MNFNMKTTQGNELVEAISNAAITLIIRNESTLEEAYIFAERKLLLLSKSDDFKEAFRPKVRNAVYQSIMEYDNEKA